MIYIGITICTHSTITMTASRNINSDDLLLFHHSPTGKLPNVTIMSVVPRTTDARIVLNNILSDIGRVNVGYERHDLGVTLQGEYANIGRRTQHTFSSLVPGARYTVVVQGLTAAAGDRSEHVTREDVKTEEKGQGNIRFYIFYIVHILLHNLSHTRWYIKSLIGLSYNFCVLGLIGMRVAYTFIYYLYLHINYHDNMYIFFECII